MLIIKICGITSVEDARAAAALGADWLGVNFVPSSKRFIEPSAAHALIDAAQLSVTWVGVVADLGPLDLQRVRTVSGVHCLQLHGNEPASVFDALTPRDFKAVRVASKADVESASVYPGDWLLTDAKPEDGALGGSGHRFDWPLVRGLARERRLMLAGGLRPDNVAEAVSVVSPSGVDVASGVESAPGQKDARLMAEFIRRARQVSQI
jgi:phosphoribosylanthranilate isomerase